MISSGDCKRIAGHVLMELVVTPLKYSSASLQAIGASVRVQSPFHHISSQAGQGSGHVVLNGFGRRRTAQAHDRAERLFVRHWPDHRCITLTARVASLLWNTFQFLASFKGGGVERGKGGVGPYPPPLYKLRPCRSYSGSSSGVPSNELSELDGGWGSEMDATSCSSEDIESTSGGSVSDTGSRQSGRSECSTEVSDNPYTFHCLWPSYSGCRDRIILVPNLIRYKCRAHRLPTFGHRASFAKVGGFFRGVFWQFATFQPPPPPLAKPPKLPSPGIVEMATYLIS